MALAPTGIGSDDYGSDIRLVTAHRTGNREAFEEIVRTHYPTLLACARRRLGNAADAEDAVQETLMNAFRALDRFGDTGDWRLGAWLNTILTNVCKDLAARRKPTALLDEWVTDSQPQGHVQDIAELAPDPVALEAVSRAIASLPVARRRAFLLRMVDDLPYDEVAGEMGISEDNARAYVSRACKTLRHSLRSASAISGTLAAAPLLLVGSLRAVLRRTFSGSAGHPATTTGAQALASPASSSTAAAISASPVGTSIQILGQVASTPAAQAVVSTAGSGGRGSVVLGLVALAAGGLSVPVVAHSSSHPSTPAPAVAAPVPAGASGGPSPSSGHVAGRQAPANGTAATQPGAAGSTGPAAGTSRSSQTPTAAVATTKWVRLAETASVNATTPPSSTTSSTGSSAGSTGSSSSAGSSSSTGSAAGSTGSSAGSTGSSSSSAGSSSSTGSAAGSTGSSSSSAGSAGTSSSTGSSAGSTGSSTGAAGTSSTPSGAVSTRGASTPSASSTPSTSTQGTSGASVAGGHGFTLPIGSCTGVPGFPGVTKPTSVPPLSSSVLDAILSTGTVPLTSPSTSPSFSSTASVNATAGSSAPVHVKIGTCLAEGGSILAVDMTTQTGNEWRLVGSLVSRPFGGPTGTGPTTSGPVDYLFRGSVTQIAGTSGPSDGLPWSLPPNFVAEVQVLEPSDTAALTVVFLDPLGQPTPGAATASTGQTATAVAATSANAGSTGGAAASSETSATSVPAS